MTEEMINEIVYRVYRAATNAAVHGNPLGGIGWIPSTSATDDGYGILVLFPCPPLRGSDLAPWE